MKRQFLAVLLASLLTSVAFAQETEEVHMDLGVGPSAGGEVKVEVRVKQKATTVVDDTEEHPAEGARHHHRRQVERDCGMSQDPGCGMTRDGQFAMDAETFRGLLQALKSNANEISRSEICKTTFDHAYLTAAQLGAVLDLFRNEITRLEVAQAAAPRIVNPLQALGFASKWKNSISAQEYTQLMASQH